MSGFRTLLLFIGIIAVFATGEPSRAVAAKRIALVVGIDQYPNLGSSSQLRKAVNDARSMGSVLREIGFEPTVLVNSTRAQMSQAIGDIEQSIGNGDTVFFFFSGHGVELSGANYLLPGDVPAPVDPQGRRLPARAISDASFNAAEVLSSFQRRGAGTVIAVLDACREAFSDEVSRVFGVRGGLAEMRPPQNMFIMYSAGARQTALDRLNNSDSNPNSIFTRTLLPILKEPGLSLVNMAKTLQPRVSSLAKTINHDQNPAYYDQIEGDFYLVPGSATQKGFGRLDPSPSPLPSPAPNPCAGAAEHYRSAESMKSIAALRDHISRYPNCDYVRLAELQIAALTPTPIPTPTYSPPAPQGDSSICRAPGSLWNMDGSSVVLKASGKGREFYFCSPGGSASAEGAVAGNILFSGQRLGDSYSGTAYVNAGRCGKFGYSVSGDVFDGQRGVTLSGSRPVIDPNTCKETGRRPSRFTLTYRQVL